MEATGARVGESEKSGEGCGLKCQYRAQSTQSCIEIIIIEIDQI